MSDDVASGGRISATAAAIAAMAALSGLLIGYNTAVIAPALPFLSRHFHLSPGQEGVVVAAILVGGFAGSLLAGGASRRWGGRLVLMGCAVLFGLGACGAALAGSAPMLTLWRLVLGLAVGAASAIAPLYVGETAPSRWRGALVSAIQLAITLGILLAYLAGTALTRSANWPAMLAAGGAPAILMLAGLACLPESPRWLFHTGRPEAALQAWQRIGAGDTWPPRTGDDAATAPVGDWRALFTPRLRPVLLLATGLFAFANLSGIDAVLYYAPTIFAAVGFTGALGPILATSGIGAINVLATIVAMGLIDRLGRRRLLLLGLVPMTASLLALALALGLAGEGTARAAIALLCLGVFVTGFAISLGPLPYVLMAEVFPQSVRGQGMGLAAAAAWGANIAVSASFPPLLVHLGVGWTFALYGLISAAAILFVLAMVPETRGRSLERIEANLARGCRVRDLGAM